MRFAPRILRFSHIIVLCVTCMGSGLTTNVTASDLHEIGWGQLVPPDWNPNSVFEHYTDEEFMALSDEEFNALQEEAQKLFDAAPTVDTFDGKRVRIPGYILPLDFSGDKVKEFLLVPNFGACIHTPPPPANQVIHGTVVTEFPLNGLFEAVWISGKLTTVSSVQQLSEIGYDELLGVSSGYAMNVERIEPYHQ